MTTDQLVAFTRTVRAIMKKNPELGVRYKEAYNEAVEQMERRLENAMDRVQVLDERNRILSKEAEDKTEWHFNGSH